MRNALNARNVRNVRNVCMDDASLDRGRTWAR